MKRNTEYINQRNSCFSDFIIRIKSGQGFSVRGKIEHIHSGQVHYFDDFLEMLLLMQNKLDEKDFPQSDTLLRSFTEKAVIREG
ncbi:MAG: hypothetical protein SCJ97_10205 [Bacillota bacterium]|nr:hypothetical protein [Bacillota bacterium]